MQPSITLINKKLTALNTGDTGTDAQESWFPLKPITAKWIHNLLDQPTLFQNLLDKYGAPINIHHPSSFVENYKSYQQVFDKHHLDHLVLFARKANKCRSFVKTAEEQGFGVDTASYWELKECLELGVDPANLVMTAAIKDPQTYRLAIKFNVLLIVDNLDECQQIQKYAEELGKTARVGFRVSGFEYEGEKLYSRFGFDIEQVSQIIQQELGYTGCCHLLKYEGLHFHLDGYSIPQRAVALHACLDLAEELNHFGFKTKFIDIGGGILMNYLESEKEWNDFDAALKEAVRGDRDPITFRNNGLGYEIVDGALRGKKKVYPYFNKKSKAEFLDAILSYRNDHKKSCAERLYNKSVQIRMEPGRSLLDQCGITVTRVAHRKQDSEGNILVGLEMNMTQMHSSSADFLLDPYYIHQDQQAEAAPVDVYFTGAYCLERDVLLKRKIRLQQYPQIGDLVIFVNTAGYMMHFFESEAHLFKLATNLVYQSSEERDTIRNFIDDRKID